MPLPLQYPWPVKPLTSVFDLRVGDRVPAIPSVPANAAQPGCANCLDHGIVYAYEVKSGGGKVHYFDDGRNFPRMMFAELLSAPCPVCRHPAAPPAQPEGARTTVDLNQEELPL